MQMQSEELATGILESLTNGVILLDRELVVRRANRSAERLLGLTGGALAGLAGEALFSQELLDTARRVAAEGRQRLGVSGAARSPGGRMLPVRANVSPFRGEQGGSGAGSGAVLSFARLASLD